MRLRKVAGVLVGLSLLAAACGDDSDESSSGDASETTAATETGTDPGDEADSADAPAATEAPDEPVGDVPSAIISLSPTATEMLYAIGAGDQVLAVDDFSNYPPEAADKMMGLSAFEPNVEAIAALEPDLVLTDGTNPDLLAQFDQLGIAHWEGPAAEDFGDIYAQIEQLGAATGNVGAAAELVAQMQADIDAAVAALPDPEAPLTYYHELDPSYFSVSSETFIGRVYSLAGLRNITDLVETDAGAYPQLNAEFIIDSDPDLIFLACTKYCGETAESIAARDGWGDLTAVTTGAVVELDDDVASRWGPRVVDFVEQVGASVDAVVTG